LAWQHAGLAGGTEDSEGQASVHYLCDEEVANARHRKPVPATAVGRETLQRASGGRQQCATRCKVNPYPGECLV
jgi:hypothetical protein